jgi:hypothetical protein
MSFKVREFGNHSKKYILHMVYFHNLDVVLLYEMMRVRDKILRDLSKLMKDQDLPSINFIGIFRALITRWRNQTMRPNSSMVLESIIGVELISLELGEVFFVVNIYGPYEIRWLIDRVYPIVTL